MLRLACLLLLVFAASSCGETPVATVMWNFPRPYPEPGLPAGCDPFNPPALGLAPSAGAPALAEWTRTGGPDAVIAMTGSRLAALGSVGSGSSGVTSARFEVFGQNAAGSYTGTTTVFCDDGVKSAVALPAALPANSEYMIWPVNESGTGAPAVVNATEAWWIGPNVATRGVTVSVYGRNLVHDSTTANASHVYIQRPAALGVWATVTAANPYKVDFTVPAGLGDGTYQVWIHNGRGGHYGWSGPLALTINDGMPWSSHVYNVKSYGAKGDGVTDDQAAINNALTAAGNDPWSTIYLPAGTYMVSLGFAPPSQVRWMGDGAARTIIRANANFVQPAQYNGRAYCLLFSPSGSSNVDVENLTLDANGNMNGYLAMPVYMRFDTDLRFVGVTINAKDYQIADFHGSTRLAFQGCNFIGTGGGVFFGSATQVAVNGCNVYGTNDANTLLANWGGDSISYTNTTGQDYDNTTATGWAQGRFIYGSDTWGSNRNIYIGNCSTKAMAVRPAYSNQNTGEQLLWESSTQYSGTPLSATAATVTFPVDNFFSSNTGLAAGEFDAVIANGTGLGQHRKIVASSGTTITVSPAWNVAPDATSTVLIGGVVSHCAIYQNSLQGKSSYTTQNTASAGIQPFGNSFDFVADGNAISQVRTGIGLWGMSMPLTASTSINCAYFNYVANNTVSQCLNGIANISQAWNGWPTGAPYPGISSLANVCTGNAVSTTAESGLAQWASAAPVGDQEDLNVFAHNALATTPVGLQTESSGHVNNTQSYKNTMGAGVTEASSVQ